MFSTKLVELVEDEFLVTTAPGTQKKVRGIGLVLEDTILFPEGGGQPCDEGILTIESVGGPVEVEVSYVFKRDGKVIHLTGESWDCKRQELPTGTIVHQTLHWPRRHYHMLQHTGQHLISALAEQIFQLETLSWCLGPECSFVELDAEKITEEQYKRLEAEANAHIRRDHRVIAHVYQYGDPELKKASTRGLPEGHEGDIRVIEIEGVDNNMCCGTHVSSLKQLEVIKFLKTGKKVFKKKKTCLLYFVVGMDRVFQKFDAMYNREGLISACLNKQPEEHVATIVDMKDSLIGAKKAIKNLQKEVVMLLINAFKEKESNPPLFCYHRPDGDLELLNFISRQFKGTNVVLLLTIGEKEEGNLLFEGPKDLVSEFGPKLCSLFMGKGQVNGNRFQARVLHLSSREKAEDLIKQAMTSSTHTAAS